MSELFVHNPSPLSPYAPRAQGDHYPTNTDVIKAAVNHCLPAREFANILEPGAGNNAPFLQVLGDVYPDAWLYAVEERDPIQPEHLRAKYNSVWLSRTHYIRDFEVDQSEKYDLIATNPPFGDRWEQDQYRLNKTHWQLEQEKAKGDPTYKAKRRKMPARPDNEPRADAEAFLIKSMELLQDSGIYFALMRLAFWSGLDRATGVFTKIRPYRVSVIAPRPSFLEFGSGTDGTEYAFFTFEKGYNPKRPELDFCIWR